MLKGRPNCTYRQASNVLRTTLSASIKTFMKPGVSERVRVLNTADIGSDATRYTRLSSLLARHAAFGQDPTMSFRSMTAVRFACLAIRDVSNFTRYAAAKNKNVISLCFSQAMISFQLWLMSIEPPRRRALFRFKSSNPSDSRLLEFASATIRQRHPLRRPRVCPSAWFDAHPTDRL